PVLLQIAHGIPDGCRAQAEAGRLREVSRADRSGRLDEALDDEPQYFALAFSQCVLLPWGDAVCSIGACRIQVPAAVDVPRPRGQHRALDHSSGNRTSRSISLVQIRWQASFGDPPCSDGRLRAPFPMEIRPPTRPAPA